MYMVSNWIIDGVNNKLYKYTNDIQEAVYDINVTKSIGNAAIAVSTNESSIFITCPTAGTVMEFNTGTKVFVRSITVGGNPMGICEGIPYGDGDLTKPYFVTNYADNSVSIIKNGSVVQTLSVGFGPRSLATDGYGKIFVGNYLDGTVTVLIAKENKYITLKTIKVDTQPIAVAVNYNNDVYVACKSSIIKIRKDGSVRRFTIDGRPTSLTADKYGNVWSTINTNNSIIKINSQEQIVSFSSGSEGPMYCCSDKDGDIIILNTGTNKITRLNEDGSLVNTIELDYTPIGNGDFIGFLSRINILDDIHIHGDEKVEWDDLSPELQERIEQGGVDPSTLELPSEHITYNAMNYETVEQALNGIIYEQSGLLSSDIEQFEIEPAIAEKGTIVDTVTFRYRINKKDGLTIASIDNGIGTISVDSTTHIASGLDITNDTEFTLTANTEIGLVGKKTANIKFDGKIYYGISANDITTAAGVLGLSGSAFINDTDDERYTHQFTIGGANGYIYIAIPKSLDITIDDFTTAGFRDSNWEILYLTITIHGISTMYTLFKSGYTHNLTGTELEIVVNKKK